jgi:hypothetical protein
MVKHSDQPLQLSLRAKGDSRFGRGNRGALPLHIQLESNDIELQPGNSMNWEMTLRAIAPESKRVGSPTKHKLSGVPSSPGPDYLHQEKWRYVHRCRASPTKAVSLTSEESFLLQASGKGAAERAFAWAG